MIMTFRYDEGGLFVGVQVWTSQAPEIQPKKDELCGNSKREAGLAGGQRRSFLVGLLAPSASRARDPVIYKVNTGARADL